MKYYVVYRCGSADCFPQEIFENETEAYKYGELYCTDNPEGFRVQEFTDVKKLFHNILTSF